MPYLVSLYSQEMTHRRNNEFIHDTREKTYCKYHLIIQKNFMRDKALILKQGIDNYILSHANSLNCTVPYVHGLV